MIRFLTQVFKQLRTNFIQYLDIVRIYCLGWPIIGYVVVGMLWNAIPARSIPDAMPLVILSLARYP